MLTDVQVRFLEARSKVQKDEEAAKEVGVHPSRVSHWKKDSKEFLIEYQKVVAETEFQKVVASGGMEAVVRRKIEAHAEEIMQELLGIIRGGKTENARVAAIRLAMELGGMTGEKRVSVTEVGPNLRRALVALGPVYQRYLREKVGARSNVPLLEGGEIIEGEVIGDDDAGGDSG